MNEVEIVVTGRNKFGAAQAAIVKQLKGIKTAADEAGSAAVEYTARLERSTEKWAAHADRIAGVTKGYRSVSTAIDSLSKRMGRLGEEADATGRSADKAIDKGVTESAEEAEAAVGRLLGRLGGFGAKASTVGRSVADAVTKPFTSAVDKVTDVLPDALRSPGLMTAVSAAGLPLGAAAGGAVVLGFGAGMAGLGLATQARTAEVRTTFSRMADDISESWGRVTRPFRSTLLSVADDIKDAYGSVAPALERTFSRLAPAVTDFSDQFFRGLTRFDAFESMGRASEKVLADIGGRWPRVINNLSNDFDSLAVSIERNPKALGQIIELTGKLAGSVVSDLGTLNSEFGGITEELEMIQNFLKHGKYELNVELGIGEQGQDSIVKHSEKLQDVFRKVSGAVEGSARSTYSAKSASEQLEGAWRALADAGDDLGKRSEAAQRYFDVLTGRTPTYEEANQRLNDSIRGLIETFSVAENHANGYGKALVNVDGTVNTTTKNGSELYDTIQELQGGFAEAATAVRELENAGWSHDAAVQKVNEDMRTQYDRLLANAGQMGLTRDQMQRLLDTYGLTPHFLDTIARLDENGVPQKLDHWSRTRNVIFRGVLDMSQIPSGATYKMGEYGGYAHGGVSGGGWTTVGEMGVERVKLPPGSYVQANTRSQPELAKTGVSGGGAWGGEGRLTVNLSGMPPAGTARQYLDWLAGELRANGIRIEGWTA